MQRLDERVDVLGVLDEFDVAERRRDALGRVHRQAALPAVGRLRPQTVLGVDDQRCAGEACRDPPEDAGLGVVGVHDVGAQRAQQSHELAERPEVVERVVRAGEGGYVDVLDAHRGEVGHVGSGGRHADHLVAGGVERSQLRPEQPVEAHVGGGDVDDARPFPRDRPAHDRSPPHRTAPR